MDKLALGSWCNVACQVHTCREGGIGNSDLVFTYSKSGDDMRQIRSDDTSLRGAEEANNSGCDENGPKARWGFEAVDTITSFVVVPSFSLLLLLLSLQWM